MNHQPMILIADDDVDYANVLAKRCASLGLDVRVCHDASQVLAMALELRPDVICLDVNMPSGNGLSVCDLIVNNIELADVPVVMLTGSQDQETIQRCHFLAAYYVVKHPDVWCELSSLLQQLLHLAPGDDGGIGQDQADRPTDRMLVRTDGPGGNQPTQQLVSAVFSMLGAHSNEAPHEPAQRSPEDPPWILIIEDDRDFSWALKLRLESHGVEIARAFEGGKGVQSAFAYPADVILLDFELPNGHGDYVLWRLKGHPMTKDIPVIMVTGRKEKFLERRVLGMGAAAFLTKPVDMPALLDELAKHIPILPWDGEPVTVER